MRSGDLAGAIGRGLVAGAVGTAAITVSTMVANKLRGQEESLTPVKAVEKLGDLEPQDERAERRMSNAVHWLYGAALGVPRGILGALGMPRVASDAVHLGMVWGGELTMLPKLDLAPPPSRWGPAEIALDGWHHLVYSAATGAACSFLERRSAAASAA